MKWKLFFVTKFEIFCENHHPTRHIKYKVIKFAPKGGGIVNKIRFGKKILKNIKFWVISKSSVKNWVMRN